LKLYKNTVSDLLWETLVKLMNLNELSAFRLVGGTSLSLQLGHRMSVDIDLFTDVPYDSIDFDRIDKLFLDQFSYVDMSYKGNIGNGKSYYIGNSKFECVKVDLFYTEPFGFEELTYDGVRLSSTQEIATMKLEVIGHSGRKKDFWDIHELMNHFSLSQMITFYENKYQYGHTKEELVCKLIDFEDADEDFNPICLKNKYWELIKLDIQERIKIEFK
jgi:hypothetical protein